MKRPDGVTILGILHFVVGGLMLLTACALVTIPFIVAAAVSVEADPEAAVAVPIVAIVMLVVIVFLLLLAAANAVVGWGLWTLKPWARMGAIFLAILRLFNVPIGTVIGALTLWYLFQPEGRAAFEQ